METGERCVYVSWREGDFFPSGYQREDGTMPHDNLVCRRCQREACLRLEVDWWLDRDRDGSKLASAGWGSSFPSAMKWGFSFTAF
jgi:hypothetical protein